jgi:putative polyhydroxyalkanoic acid system protein
MPVIKLSVPHQLGTDEAKKRITKLLGETKAHYGDKISDLEESWVDNRGQFRFKAMGFSVSGNLEVQAGQVAGELNLPFAALPFKSKIESDLSTRAKELLA